MGKSSCTEQIDPASLILLFLLWSWPVRPQGSIFRKQATLESETTAWRKGKSHQFYQLKHCYRLDTNRSWSLPILQCVMWCRKANVAWNKLGQLTCFCLFVCFVYSLLVRDGGISENINRITKSLEDTRNTLSKL